MQTGHTGLYMATSILSRQKFKKNQKKLIIKILYITLDLNTIS